MNTLLFLLFCLAIGYVCIWVLVNERQGNPDGDWGFIAMRTPKPEPKTDVAEDTKEADRTPRGPRVRS